MHLFDPKELPVPSPPQLEAVADAALPERVRSLNMQLTRSSRESLIERIRKLEKEHKGRHLGILVSWDFESMNWGAMVSFNPKKGFGRGTIQFYGAPTAERLVEGIEKSFNEEKVLDLDDDRLVFSVSSDVVAHLLKKQAS